MQNSYQLSFTDSISVKSYPHTRHRARYSHLNNYDIEHGTTHFRHTTSLKPLSINIFIAFALRHRAWYSTLTVTNNVRRDSEDNREGPRYAVAGLPVGARVCQGTTSASALTQGSKGTRRIYKGLLSFLVGTEFLPSKINPVPPGPFSWTTPCQPVRMATSMRTTMVPFMAW
jgi:hypothetical protein